jgi:hypothetical protein
MGKTIEQTLGSSVVTQLSKNPGNVEMLGALQLISQMGAIVPQDVIDQLPNLNQASNRFMVLQTGKPDEFRIAVETRQQFLQSYSIHYLQGLTDEEFERFQAAEKLRFTEASRESADCLAAMLAVIRRDGKEAVADLVKEGCQFFERTYPTIMPSLENLPTIDVEDQVARRVRETEEEKRAEERRAANSAKSATRTNEPELGVPPGDFDIPRGKQIGKSLSDGSQTSSKDDDMGSSASEQVETDSENSSAKQKR